jgi:hypothetical protein
VIYKTTDGGNTWTSLSNSTSFHFVNSIVVSPNNSLRVYAGTESGVMRSTDGGSNWTNVLNPSVTGGCLGLVIRTDQATDYILASCGTFAPGTVYRNTDAAGSGTWNPVLFSTNQGLTSLAIAPSSQGTIYALAATNQSGNLHNGLLAVYRSTDGGGTWATRVDNTSLTKLNTLLLTNPIEASLVECGFAPQESFFNQGWYDNVIAVDPADPNRVWVGGIDLFRSDDGGATWGLASNWWAGGSSFAHADQHAIVFQPGYNGTTNQTMFVGNDGGLFKTTNARAATTTDVCLNTPPAVTWTNLNNNYGATQFYYGVPYPNGTTYFGGTQDNGTDRGTDGGGITGWSEILGGDGGAVAVDSTNTNVIYAENTGLSIAKSTNGGSTWADATSGIGENPNDFLFIAPFIMDPSNTQRLWTGGHFLWRTTNGAGAWTQASAVLPGTGSVSAIAVAPSNANVALAGMSSGGVIVRTNIAVTSTSSTVWAAAVPRTGYVAGLTFDPGNANIAYAAYSTFNTNVGDNHIYKSTDGGATWVGIDGSGMTGLPDVPAHGITVDPHNASRLYVGTDLGVFVSVDGGANWARENTGFANVITESLTVNTVGQTSTLFAFTHGRGAWRVTIPSSGNPDTIGLYTPSTGGFAQRFSNTAGGADNSFFYGPPNLGWIPLAGDWNGDGIVTPGLYDPSTGNWFLRNSNTTGVADITFAFGPANLGWIPIVGDWDGNGTDTVGLYDPIRGLFFLKNSNSTGVADLTFAYGPGGLGWQPIVGHWNGAGADTIGLFDPSSSIFFLKNSNSTGVADTTFAYGPPNVGWLPIVGDWDGNGTDTVGLFRASASTWFLKNSNTTGVADITFVFGSGGTPLTGRWQ